MPALEWDCPDHDLVVEGGESSSDERSNPEDPLVIPRVLLVVDNGNPKASGRVDPCASDGDGRQMNQKHREADRQRRQHLLK